MALEAPLTLNCGLQLQNRLTKVALAENLAESHRPGDKIHTLYQQWGQGGWGTILTGNVMVDVNQRGSPNDVAIVDEQGWKHWAELTQRNGSAGIVQLNHPGRQSPFFCRKGQCIAPSPIMLNLGGGFIQWMSAKLVFGTPREMTKDDIKQVVDQFARAAKHAEQAGFKGVQIHGAHGYLVSTFLTKASNQRTDEYGGSPQARAQIVRDIVKAIRAVTSPSFCLCLKINSADHMDDLEESLAQLESLSGLDFIEISGGSYENPRMMAGTSTGKREAFFLEYAHKVRERLPNLPLMVTGGFRSRAGMKAALEENACDLIGLGRPACDFPHLPKDVIFNSQAPDEAVKLSTVKVPFFIRMLGIQSLTAGLVTIHFQLQLKRLVGRLRRAALMEKL